MSKENILERVLLLMKYDSSQTLSENLQVIVEQGVPNQTSDTVLSQALWLNNDKNYASKDFKTVWYLFLGKVASMTLTELKNLSKELSQKGYGPITPGLYGFNKPNAGIANIIIENQIYALLLSQYNKDVKSKTYYNPQTGKNESYAVKPQSPQYNLLSGIIGLRASTLDIKNKIPSQILKTIQQGDNKPKSGDKCYFNNKTEGDNFRIYVNTVYPEIAKNLKLSKSGDFCNDYIKKTYEYKLPKGKTIGQEYAIYMSYNPKKAKEDLMKISREDLGYGGDRLDTERDIKIQIQNAEEQKKSLETAKKIEDDEQKKIQQYEEWKKSELKKYNFGTFPSPKDYNMGKPVYSSQTWKEPNTGRVFFIQGKTLKDIKDEIISEIEYNEQQKFESEILNNPKLVQIFGKDRIDNAIKNCKKENLVQFFEKVLNGKYKINGNVVGNYAKNYSGNSFFVTWPTNELIPCKEVTWDKYGLYIQLGGMLAIGLLTGGLGLAPSAALLVELAADTALNLYSLQKSVESGDEDAIKMDLAYIFLPFAMSSSPIKALLKQAKFGDDVIKSVESKLKSLPRNATTSQVDNLINNMTPEEQRLIKELGTEEYSEPLKKVSAQTMNGLNKTAKGPIGRRISNPLIKILVYGTPVTEYTVKKITDSLQLKTNRKISEEDKKLWEIALSYLNTEDRDILSDAIKNIDKETANKVIDLFEKGDIGVKTKQEIKKIVQGNMSDEEFDKTLNDLDLKIQELTKKTLETINKDDEIILLDEPILN